MKLFVFFRLIFHQNCFKKTSYKSITLKILKSTTPKKEAYNIQNKPTEYTFEYIYILDTATRVQILDCISHSTNTLAKGMNPIILPPAMGK